MPITRSELQAALSHMYGPIYRIVHTLCGHGWRADRALDFVIDRGVNRADRWRDEMDAQRWFLHHTLLAVRRFGPGGGEIRPADDPLQLHGPAGDPAYTAMVRALRALPAQQFEAVVLHSCSHLNERYLAVAMDCSVGAAQNHLDAGLQQLRAIAGREFERLITSVAQAYRAIGPADDAIDTTVSALLSRRISARRARTFLRQFAVAVLLALAAWATWRFLR